MFCSIDCWFDSFEGSYFDYFGLVSSFLTFWKWLCCLGSFIWCCFNFWFIISLIYINSYSKVWILLGEPGLYRGFSSPESLRHFSIKLVVIFCLEIYFTSFSKPREFEKGPSYFSLRHDAREFLTELHHPTILSRLVITSFLCPLLFSELTIYRGGT